MSEYLFVTCSTCKKEISKSSDKCPQCGAKMKKTNKIGVVISLIALILFIKGFTSGKGAQEADSNNSRLPSSAIQIPSEETKFIDIVTKHTESFESAKNELQESAFRDLRKSELSKNFKRRKFEKWQGTIDDLQTNTDGKAILEVKISNGIIIKTWNNALSDIAVHTMIDKNTPVYAALLNMKKGDKIVFSGSFLPSDEDHFEEASLTIQGSMKNPEFLFLFSSITPQ